MKIKDVLKDSFLLLLKKPKLFIPKIFVAFLYSLLMLAMPKLAISSLLSPTFEIFWQVLLLLLFTLAVSLFDICINSIFPFFVRDYFKGKDLSFRKALLLFMKRGFPAVASPLTAEIIALFAIAILSMPVSFSLFFGNYALTLFFILLEVVIIFALAVAFFLVYPVASLSKEGTFESLRKSIGLAKKNLNPITKLAIFSFLISALTFAISFAIEFSSTSLEKWLFLLVFILLRLVVALFATYQYIINPVFYVKYLKKEKV